MGPGKEVPGRQHDQPKKIRRRFLRERSSDRLTVSDTPRRVTADRTILSAPDRGGDRRERLFSGKIQYTRMQRPSGGDASNSQRAAEQHVAVQQARSHVNNSSHLSPTAKGLLNWGLALTEIMGFFTGWSPADVITAGEVLVGKTIAGHHMHPIERIVFGVLAAIPEVPSRFLSEAYYGLKYGYGPKKLR